MKYRTKLVLYKGAFIVLVVAAGGLMAYELYIPGLLGLGGAYARTAANTFPSSRPRKNAAPSAAKS